MTPSPRETQSAKIAPLEMFLDTPIVRCEDGEIIIFPKLRLVEIDGELLDRTDVLELASAFSQAIDTLDTTIAPTLVASTSSGWCIETASWASIAINGERYPAGDVESYLRSLNYALRLID